MLVDPWLVGKLTFGGLEFVYAGSKRVARPEAVDLEALAAATDVLVLTQGIDDHAHRCVWDGERKRRDRKPRDRSRQGKTEVYWHGVELARTAAFSADCRCRRPPLPGTRRPTLQRLPKTVPVVASASGAAVARSLGFRTVYTLGTDQSLTLGGLTLQGTAGEPGSQACGPGAPPGVWLDGGWGCGSLGEKPPCAALDAGCGRSCARVCVPPPPALLPCPLPSRAAPRRRACGPSLESARAGRGAAGRRRGRRQPVL